MWLKSYRSFLSLVFNADVSDLSEFKIRWEDKSFAPELPFEGIPFIILGSQTRSCHQGPLRNKTKQHSTIDHEYLKSRRQNQCSKKLGCKATVIIRSILLFPDYKVDLNSASSKKKKRDELFRSFSPATKRTLKLFVKFPEIIEHTGHLKDELATYVMGPDKVIIEKIHDLVGNGIHRVPDIKLHLQLMTKDRYPHISATDRRFYPTDKDIRNHVYNALIESRYSANDQENLRINIEKWKDSHPEDQFFYRPVTSDENDALKSKNFLFIHQTSFQKDLMLKYGQEISLMDATYNTTLYDLPLFFICVPTNVGFSIVATFVVGKESTTNIAEALSILKMWNADWKPKHFMCDFDWREINALESVFEDCFVYLCTFHREQCWTRWLAKSSHGCSDKKSEILAMLRSIADSKTEEEFSANVVIIRTSTIYEMSTILQSYLEKTWIKHHKRWVFAFRTELFNIKLNTTNGLERKHRDIKENYLKKHALGRTLVGMIESLIEDYLPDCFQRYKRYNIESLGEYKMYSESIPLFLKGRPKAFLKHCLTRLERTVGYSITPISESLFMVKSEESGHIVNLKSLMNLCDCMDFQTSHWPCKHLMKVLTKDGLETSCWYNLPEQYVNNALFNVDLLQAPTVIKTSDQPEDLQIASVIKEDIDSKLINTLKNIQSGIYGVDREDVKEGILAVLLDVEKMVTKYQCTRNGLPVIKHQLQRKGIKRKLNVHVKKNEDANNCLLSSSAENNTDVDDLLRIQEVSKVVSDYQLQEITLDDIVEIEDNESSSSLK